MEGLEPRNILRNQQVAGSIPTRGSMFFRNLSAVALLSNPNLDSKSTRSCVGRRGCNRRARPFSVWRVIRPKGANFLRRDGADRNCATGPRSMRTLWPSLFGQHSETDFRGVAELIQCPLPPSQNLPYVIRAAPTQSAIMASINDRTPRVAVCSSLKASPIAFPLKGAHDKSIRTYQ